jgi:hypothetical protein
MIPAMPNARRLGSGGWDRSGYLLEHILCRAAEKIFVQSYRDNCESKDCFDSQNTIIAAFWQNGGFSTF